MEKSVCWEIGTSKERTDGRQCGAQHRGGERTGLQEGSPQASALTRLSGQAFSDGNDGSVKMSVAWLGSNYDTHYEKRERSSEGMAVDRHSKEITMAN